MPLAALRAVLSSRGVSMPIVQRSTFRFRARAIAMLALCTPVLAAAQQPLVCSARSAQTAPQIVELYTSEGCNSCPPADKWLSTLKGRSDVVALAFHVDYWDRLGWTDRFASPAWTQRQSDVNRTSGARFSYTPQIVVNGKDYRQWPRLPSGTAAGPIELQMTRDGSGYVVTLMAIDAKRSGALAGYWAVTEDGHRTQVKAGENAGVTLLHDGVVRELQAVTKIGDAPLRFTPRSGPDAVSGVVPRKLHFIVTDARTGEPLQAVSLGC
jgi:hypothetical protein